MPAMDATITMITTRFYALLFLGALAGAGAVATTLPQQTAPAALYQDSRQHGEGPGAVDGIIELDLERVVKRRMVKRDEASPDVAGMTATGLGDALDITYNVLVQFGNISTPLVLDTGSADLWVLSDACAVCAGAPYPLYPSESLKYVADARLLYGDSRTGTHAYGVIGADRAGVAGFTLENQYFATINDTNTSVLDTGSAGIFGLGFPINSILWNELYTMVSVGSPPSTAKRQISLVTDINSRLRSPPPPLQNLAMGEDDTSNISSQTNGVDILSTFSLYGPLVSRMVINGSSEPNTSSSLASPQFSVALQRTTPSLSGDVGALTLGGLPDGVDNASLTWAPVRLYTAQQNGVVVPQAPNETYPYAWDVPLNGVYFDGARLPNSKLGDVSKPGVGQSALIDTGNSLIRGPADVVAAILSLLANSTSSPSPFVDSSPSSPDESRYSEEEYAEYTRNFNSLAYAYPCAESHTIEFQFAGERFVVDPRDFGRPIMGDPEAKWCVPNLAPTDPPEIGGYLYSWSLGEPYLRSVLASFYYGNITHPSLDLPRIGFLSTVPDDATLRLSAAMHSAQSMGGYEETTISAPTGTYTGGPVTTDTHGVVQISEAPLPFDIASSGSTSGAGRQSRQGSGSSRLRSTPLIFGFGVQASALIGAGLILLGIWL